MAVRQPSLLRRAWRSLDGGERARVGGMAAVVVGLNALGWGTFVFAVLPHNFHYRGLGVGLGAAFTAWTLGCRHAFDADHIAAIDNSTRKLIGDGKRPLASGFVFALGHSTVVLVVGVAITVAAKAVFTAVVAPSSGVAVAGGVAGTLLSTGFLWLIAALNLVVLRGLVRVFRSLRVGRYDETELEAQLAARGMMNRFFGRWMNSINHTWQLFPVGCAFGVGFDTATEVVLLGGAATAAATGLPWYAVLTLPLLFAGGMTLLDTLDGLLMNSAYGWAFDRPVRKLYYNITVTGLSVVVAFLVGGIEISGLVSSRLHLHGWLGDAIAGFDLNTAGYVMVGLFVVVWTVAISVWRWGGLESRWAAAVQTEAEAG